MIRIPASIIAEMEKSWQSLKITWCLALASSMKKLPAAALNRLKRHPLRDAAALAKHLQMMFSTIEQQMGDKQQMIDLTSSFEWDMMIDLCERDWPFLEGCSEAELDTLAELVDVAEDLLDLPAQMPPTKMPSDVYWEVINVVDSYHKNRRRNGDIV